MQVGDWVVCRLFQRKRKARNDHGTINQLANSKKSRNLLGISAHDHMNLNHELGLSFAQTSPSSCSSGVTEIPSNDLDQEASSHSISFWWDAWIKGLMKSILTCNALIRICAREKMCSFRVVLLFGSWFTMHKFSSGLII